MTTRIVRYRRTSFAIRPAVTVVGLLGTVIVAVVTVAAIASGDFPLTIADVLGVIGGGGTRAQRVVVIDVNAPRALLALLVGAAFGLSGALTQTIARNPLATPDILSITAGASAAAVVGIAFGSSWGSWFTTFGLPVLALCGSLISAVAMYLLAWRRGIDAFRLVIVGVSLTWIFQAVVSYGLTRARIDDVTRAQRWIVGSVANATWTTVNTTLIALVVGTVVVVVHRSGLSMLTLGDDLARGLGINATRVVLVHLSVAVVIAAMAVSAAGPIVFVGLLAPHIAQRLTRTPTPPPLVSAIVGAALVSLSDLLCRTILPDTIAVGVVTAAIGGPFLIYLMISVSRRARA